MATVNDVSPSFSFQKMTYIIVLKIAKFGEDRLSRYEILSKNPQGSILPHPPVQIGLRLQKHLILHGLMSVNLDALGNDQKILHTLINKQLNQKCFKM